MANRIRLRIVTPTRIMYDADVDMVVALTQEGQLGVMAGHIPLTTTLDYGIMKVKIGDQTREASVLGGFMEINNNTVTVISDVAEWPEEIDGHRAAEAKERAERHMKISTERADVHRAQLAFRRATVRLEVSSYTIIRGRNITN